MASCKAQGIFLSSDTYSGFVKDSSDKKQHQLEIERATKRLLEEVIPNYAKELKDKLVNTEFMVYYLITTSCLAFLCVSLFL